MAPLASRFEEYGNWRDSLAKAIVDLRQWMSETQLLEGDAARRLEFALDRLAEDKLVIAFVAEFSRGKSELINAIFFADYGKRILPSSAGRTTMCPTELLYDETLPPCIRALPIETRSRRGSTSDFKRMTSEWKVFPLDTASTDGMLDAFKMVAETVRVPVDEARGYGLFDGDDPDQAVAVDKHGTIEISKWRHAVINFPHPLLKHGLVILDTPGLNAIGTEPELTLSLVPNAHAVLFVLAADTGVTKSDLDVWRHVVGDAGHRNHIAVLNKIDGLWDALKTPGEIEREVRRQVHAVAATLDLEPVRVFPVSAQKGLVAKVQGDERLLEASRLPLLEEALIELLVPAKQKIVRDQTVMAAERVAAETRQALAARERGVIEQLYELRSLQGKNQSSIERMTRRAYGEQREFEEVVRKIVAARLVLSRLSEELFAPLRVSALREHVLATRRRMKNSQLSPQLAAAVKAYFAGLREMLRSANAKTLEIEQMVIGVQRRFAEELGWSLSPPMTFSLDTYIADVERAEAAYRSQFGALAVLTTDKWALMQRFFDTVVSKSREIFSAAERDTEAWVKSLLPPIEMQVREQRAQLKKRAESVGKIRDAQGSLDDRITELEEVLEDAQGKLAVLRQLSERIRDIGARARVDDVANEEALAA
ncbi:MAG: dynamin family protein [Burkholderiaceae bacterium]|jgi:predicted GTPase|nr:dynamin family protein [Burkholderiaceae bacterium]